MDDKQNLISSNLENSITKEDLLIEQVGNNKKLLIFSLESDSILKKLTSLECKIVMIVPKLNKINSFTEIDLIDLELQINQISEQFDVIILDDFLEYIQNPKNFLKKIIKLLNKTGYIVSSIHNFNHGSMRLSILDGDFKYNELFYPNNFVLKFYTLETILTLIAESGLKIINLNRIIKEINNVENLEFKENIIPKELIHSLLRDNESTAYQYVFTAIPYEDRNTYIYKWSTNFSKNLVTNDLFNRINSLKENQK